MFNMGKVIYTDNDAYFAMLKSMNEDLNIDPISYSSDAIDEINKQVEERQNNFMRWFGMVYNFNGLDVQNLINPVFTQK